MLKFKPKQSSRSITPNILTSRLGNPLVSIVINNYNYGRFIDRAIESVLAQSYRHFEIIVVDDGSTDHSREVIAAYGDRVIPIFQANGGQAAALNTGCAQAQGEIICLLDSDDYFHPDKLAEIVAGFTQHPEWVQLSHYWTVVNQQEEEQPRSQKTLSQGDVRSLLLRWGKYKFALTSALSYRREALEKVLPIPTSFRGGADAYLMVTVPFYGEIGSIPRSLMCYRVHGKNKVAQSPDFSYLLRIHEQNAFYINQRAEKIGLVDRFSLHQDADYQSFQAVQAYFQSAQKPSVGRMLQVLWLSFCESRDLGRTLRETLVRLLWLSLYWLFPQEAAAIVRHGLRRYLSLRLTNKPA